MILNLIFKVYLLTSDFLAESLKASKNQPKGHYLFYNTVSLKNLTQLSGLNSLNIVKKYFPVNMFLVGGRKKAFAQHHF